MYALNKFDMRADTRCKANKTFYTAIERTECRLDAYMSISTVKSFFIICLLVGFALCFLSCSLKRISQPEQTAVFLVIISRVRARVTTQQGNWLTFKLRHSRCLAQTFYHRKNVKKKNTVLDDPGQQSHVSIIKRVRRPYDLQRHLPSCPHETKSLVIFSVFLLELALYLMQKQQSRCT